jgi:Domain of unknown function (DUF4939)
MTHEFSSAQVNELLSRLQDANTEIAELQAQVQNQEVADVTLIPPVFGTSNPSIKEPKVNPPDAFYGDKDKSDAFLAQLSLSFQLQSSRFLDDRTKVLFAISYMKGTAFNWSLPYL